MNIKSYALYKFQFIKRKLKTIVKNRKADPSPPIKLLKYNSWYNSCPPPPPKATIFFLPQGLLFFWSSHLIGLVITYQSVTYEDKWLPDLSVINLSQVQSGISWHDDPRDVWGLCILAPKIPCRLWPLKTFLEDYI